MTAATQPLLDVEGLSVSLPGPTGLVRVIKRLDLEVQPGEIVGIAGESGSGKSLTALTLLNLLPPGAVVGGSVRFAGRELLELHTVGIDGGYLRNWHDKQNEYTKIVLKPGLEKGAVETLKEFAHEPA